MPCIPLNCRRFSFDIVMGRTRTRERTGSAPARRCPPTPIAARARQGCCPMLLTPATTRQLRRQTVLALLFTLAPGAVMLWLMAHPHQNLLLATPTRHVQIVTVVSLIAFGVAALVTWAALQIQQFRVLCLALGFLAMGGLFTVHALATPGFIFPGFTAPHAAAPP